MWNFGKRSLHFLGNMSRADVVSFNTAVGMENVTLSSVLVSCHEVIITIVNISNIVVRICLRGKLSVWLEESK